MHRKSELPPAFVVRAFRTSEARATGVSAKRLRSRDVHQPFRGLNVAGTMPETVNERATAFAHLLRPADAFSHTTAAALLGAPMPGFAERDVRLHVTTVGGGDRIRRSGVVGHTADVLAITTLGSLPIVDPAHLFAQLATVIRHDDLVASGDYLVTPRRRGSRLMPALTSLDAIRAAIPERGRGAAAARRALGDVRVGAESPMETRLRLLLVRSGLPEPQLNPAVPIGDDVLHPDLMYPQWGVVLEYEGDHHRTDAWQWRNDIWRREAFESAGLRVIRVHRDDIQAEPEAFLARLCHILAQRGRSSAGNSGG